MLEWKRMLSDWHSKYVPYVNTKTINKGSNKEWFTHKMVRKAYIHIRRALPYMFSFIECPDIPKSTNALESFFAQSPTIFGNITCNSFVIYQFV